MALHVVTKILQSILLIFVHCFSFQKIATAAAILMLIRSSTEAYDIDQQRPLQLRVQQLRSSFPTAIQSMSLYMRGCSLVKPAPARPPAKCLSASNCDCQLILGARCTDVQLLLMTFICQSRQTALQLGFLPSRAIHMHVHAAVAAVAMWYLQSIIMHT